ncbi:hypothetical protein [Roseococcus pinisoli]|uniref:Uncharacterized protein n=1 Tax=Roseococcus pinisoli TaxID=2835040 RepID=A0ABS5Q817_9PROT|nr:hypothetical protein [Roseococcus pinisoli]MBS7809582.1 hypothetical protein [Roseococcus pinisoli]
MLTYRHVTRAGWPKQVANHPEWEPANMEGDFEGFLPYSNYNWKNRNGDANRDRSHEWPIIVPDRGPPVPKELPEIIRKMVSIDWKQVEPRDGAVRTHAGTGNPNSIVIGARGMAQGPANQLVRPGGYNPQVRPTQPVVVKQGNDAAIASDWALSMDLVRTNAVTYRGDKRSPVEIQRADGFHPPASRKDRAYLEKNIYQGFNNYMQRRFNRPLDQHLFLAVVDKGLVTPDAKEILNEYIVWLSIVRKESAHLGRMVDNELLKAWISTARCLDVSVKFANFQFTPGWLYVTRVFGGYVVPHASRNEVEWGTAESEIAHYGPIPWWQVCGFMHIDDKGMPDSPIFLRRAFRKLDPVACEKIYKALSGKLPY